MKGASIGFLVGSVNLPFIALSFGTLYEVNHILFSNIVSNGAKLEVRSKFEVVADGACVEPLDDISIEFTHTMI